MAGPSDGHASRFAHLLTVQHRQALGHVDKNWFHNLSLKSHVSEGKGLKRTPICAAQDDSAVRHDDGLTAAPLGDDSTRMYDTKRNSHVGVALPLFSPAQPQGAVCVAESGGRWKRVNSGSSFSPATPGPCGVIPGLVDKTADVGILTPGVGAYTPMNSLCQPHNTSNMDGYQGGSSMKRMFKTPSTVGSSVSRKRRLTQLTGIDLNETDISWTESLATPSTTNPANWEVLPVTEERSQEGSTSDAMGTAGVARMLFSPRGAMAPSQEDEILLDNTIPEETEESYIIVDQAAAKTIECDVMKPRKEVATGLTVTATVVANASHECQLASKLDKPLGEESSKKEEHLNEDIFVSETVVRQKSFGVETQNFSRLNDASTLNTRKPEVELRDAPGGSGEESREKSMTETDTNQVDDTFKSIPTLSSGMKAQSTEDQQKPAPVSHSNEDSHNAMTNLSSGKEDSQETPFTSPSQHVSVREALSIFDTPPSCVTLKKKSVPRRSSRLRKKGAHASGDSGRLNVMTSDDDSPLLVSDDGGTVSKRCDSNGNLLSNERSSGLDAIEIGANTGGNQSPLKTKFSAKFKRRPSESDTVRMDASQIVTNVCQPVFYGTTTAQPPTDDALRCRNLDSSSSGKREMSFETPMSRGRKSLSSKPGGEDGFTQISQATLSAACEVVDNVSTTGDHPRCVIASERSDSFCVGEKGRCGEIDGGVDSEKTGVCRKDCDAKRGKGDGKDLSVSVVSGDLKLSPIVESKCHVTDVDNCGPGSDGSDSMCSAVCNGCKVCGTVTKIHSPSGMNVCRPPGQSNEVCSISATSGDMNKVCSAPCTNTQCVNAHVKVCRAGTNALPKTGQSEDNGRAVSNEDIAFTQISQSTMDEMLQAADSTHDTHAVTSVKVNSDHSILDPFPAPLSSDWSGSMSHNSRTTPNKILQHSSRENECELPSDRGYNKTLSNHRTLPDSECNLESPCVAKQQQSSVAKSKNLSFANKKRFSYPSAQQISSMLPQRVFNQKTDAFGVTDMFTRNTVDSVDVKFSGKSDASVSNQLCAGVSVASSDVVRKTFGGGMETIEISTTDMRMSTREEPIGKKGRGGKHPTYLPETEVTALESKQERDNSSTGKDTGQSRSAKQCPRSSSMRNPQSANLPSCVGFATASNKAISISEAAMETAQRLVSVPDGDGACYHGNASSGSKSPASDRACCKSSVDVRRKIGSYRQSAAVSGEIILPGRISLDREVFMGDSTKPSRVADDASKKAYALKDFGDSFSIDTSKRHEFHTTSNKGTVGDSTEVTAASGAAVMDNEDMDDLITEPRAEQPLIECLSTPDKSPMSSVCVSTPAADAKRVPFLADSNRLIDISVNAVPVKIVEKDGGSSGDGKLAQNMAVISGDSVTTNVAHRDDETTTCDRLRMATGRSDASIDVEFETEVLVGAKTETKPPDVGLQRVSGKTIELSEKNTRKNILPSDVEDKVCTNKSDGAVDRMDASTKAGDFVGFRCASGKEILVTEESVKKARDLIDKDKVQNFCDVGQEREEKLDGVQMTRDMSDNALGFAGFKCASGKGIRLSEPSIEKARKFMSAIEEESGSGDVDKRIKNCFDVGGCDAIDVTGCVAGAADAGGCCKDIISRKMLSSSASGKKSSDVVCGPTKDYSHLPKGFRPFKAPAMIPKRSLLRGKKTDKSYNTEPMETDAIKTHKGTSEEQKGVALKEISAEKTEVSIDDLRVTSGHTSELKEAERSFTRETSPGSVHGFDDEEFDDLTYTQISEITDLTVACLQHQQEFEDGAFSQAPCKHGLYRAENTLGVIVEENVSGDFICGDGKGGNESRDMEIKPRDEEMMARDVVTSDAEYCGFVCDNGGILSEIDRDEKADISEERESAIMGLSRRRDKLMSGAPRVRGKKVGVREKVAGRTDNLLGDLSQLSEWDGDCSFSGSVVEDPMKTCDDGQSSAPLAVDDVSGLSPKRKSGALKDGCTVSGVDNHHILSNVGDETITIRSTNSMDGLLLSTASTICTGLTTARGNMVSVSDKALEESRKISDDTEITSVMSENAKLCVQSPNKASTICTGFTTARGNKVSVSDKALKESRKIFDDTDNNSKTPENVKLLDDGNFKSLGPLMETASTICTGFTTAGGNKVSVSDEALKESRKIFDDIGLNSKDCTVEKSSTHGQASDNRAELFTGFLTAGGSKQLSNKALKESKKIFEDFETGSKDFEQNDASIPVLPLNTGVEHTTGFSTASGNKVSVLEKAMKDSSEVSNDDKCFIKATLHELSPSAANTCFTGFATARGSKMLVSEKALKESRNVFNDDECFVKYSTNTTLCEPSSTESGTCFTGFATAGGNKVSVSEKALKESRKVFNDDECFVKDCTNTTLHEPSTVVPGSRFTGFATARGDKVSVSEKALKESRKVFDDDESFLKDSTNTTLHEPSTVAPGSCFTGFATTGGDKVSVSEKALKESRRVFNDDECFVKDSTRTTLHEPSTIVPGTCFSGFATARGDKVSVSEKALKESRRVFNDEECFVKDSTNTALHEPSTTESGSCFSGFATAIGNKVSVSEKALKESRKVFDDDESFIKDPTNTTLHEPSTVAADTCFSGFATARGDKVSVSEKALKESRKMFVESKTSVAEDLALRDCEILELAGNDAWTSYRITEPNRGDLHPNIGCGEAPVPEDVLIKVRCQTEDGNDGGIVGKNSGFRKNIVDAPSVESPQDSRATSGGIMEEGENESRARRWSHHTSTPAVTDRRWKTAARGRCQGVSSLRPFPRWLSPITSSPDKCLRDRTTGSRLVALRSVQATPDHDDSALIGSKGTSCSVGASLGGATPQRPSFMAQSAPKSLSNQPLLIKTGNDSFAPPFKKIEAAFSTPYRQDPQSAFKTPIKSSGGPDHLRKRLAYADQHSPQPEKKLKLHADCGSQSELVVGTVSLDESARNMETKPGEKSSENRDEYSEVQQDQEEGKTNVAPESSVAGDKWCHLEVAREAQLKRIEDKRSTQSVKPISGALFAMKTTTSRRVSLKHAVSGATPGGHDEQQLYARGVATGTLHVTAANAEEFRFMSSDYLASDNLEGVRVGDGAFVIFHEDGTAGKEEFCNAFLDMAGVEPSLVSREWVFNHYRWIVWKLAAMEVAFPGCFAGRCLTPDQVMLQFKYRYDREIDNSQRGALKKIYERDDTTQKTLILCVSAIKHEPTLSEDVNRSRQASPGTNGKPGEGKKDWNTGLLELTDGWYPITASLDAPLTRLVAGHKIQVGDKLCICGADLVGPRDGAPPLQGIEGTSLKLSANSTRRARWDAKLGYASHPHPMLVPLCSLLPDGGTVGGIDVVITRVYPLQFMQKLPDGSNVFRCARAEQKEAQKFDRDRQRTLEDAYGKLQMEFERRSQFHTDEREEKDLQTEFQQRLSELQENLPNRTIVPLLKVRLAGLTTKDIDSHASAVLSVWRPSPEVQDMMTEGRRFKIYHLVASEPRGRQPGLNVTLSATRTTRYLKVPVDDNLLDLVYEPREVLRVDEMRVDLRPPHGEVDIVGVVVRVSDVSTFDRPGGVEGSIQTVCLSDSDGQMMAIKFWRTLAVYGLKDLLSVGAVVAVTNLQWRHDARNRLPTVTANELSVFSVKSWQPYQVTAVQKLDALLKDTEDFIGTQQNRLQRITAGIPASATTQSVVTPSRYRKENSFCTATPSGDTNNRSWRPNMAQDLSHMTTPVSTITKGNAPSHTQLSRCWSREVITTPCGRGTDASVENDSPVVARQRAAQRAKAWRLECYRTPVDNLSPLPGAIPVGVRKAFKSPLVTRVMSTPMKDSHDEDNTTSKTNPLSESTGNLSGNNSDISPGGPCIESTENMSANIGDPDTQNGHGSGHVNGTQSIDEPCSNEGLSDDSCNEGSLQTEQGKKRIYND